MALHTALQEWRFSPAVLLAHQAAKHQILPTHTTGIGPPHKTNYPTNDNQESLGLSNVPIMTVSEPDLAMARRRASSNFANIRGQHRIVKAINNLLRGQEEQQWMTLPAIYNRLLLQPMPTWAEFIAAFKTFRILYQTYEQYHLEPNAIEGNYTKTIWYTLKSKYTR